MNIGGGSIPKVGGPGTIDEGARRGAEGLGSGEGCPLPHCAPSPEKFFSIQSANGVFWGTLTHFFTLIFTKQQHLKALHRAMVLTSVMLSLVMEDRSSITRLNITLVASSASFNGQEASRNT